MNKALIIATCLLVSAVLGVFVIYPKYQVLNSETAKAKAQGENLASRVAYYQDLAKIDEELGQYGASLSKIDLALPQEISVPLTFDFFQKEIAQSGLVLKSLSQISSASSLNYPGLLEHNISVSASGPYEVFKNFLASLEKSARFVGIKQISFSSPAQKEASFTINLSLDFYSY